MTLSNWLKTYIYNPLMLAMMKRIPSPSLAPFLTVFAFFVTFFLVGVWHGQTSMFLVFGITQGAGVSGNKLYQVLIGNWLGKKRYKALAQNPLYHALARGLTFTFFAFSLIFFWADWGQVHMLREALGLAGPLVVFAVATLALTLWETGRSAVLSVRDPDGVPLVTSRYLRTALTTAMVAVIAAATMLLNAPAPDIVYKTF
jgi:cytosine/uracil/thiamine/allantoin permease